MANKIKLNRVLALEISEENIVGCEISLAKGLVNLNAGFKINVPVFNDLNQTIDQLKTQLRIHNVKSKDVVIGFSMQYFKLFPVPIPNNIPHDEIGTIISQEGGVNISQEVFGYMPLRSTQRQEQDGITRYDVLGISVQKSFISTADMIATKLGLKLKFVTPSFLGLAPFLVGQPANALTSTLWISQIKSELVLWSGQEPIYEHLILTHQMNEQVSQTVTFLRAQMPGADLNEFYTCGPGLFDLDMGQIPFNLKTFSLSQDIVDVGQVTQKISINELITPMGLALITTGSTTVDVPNLLDIDVQPSYSQSQQGNFNRSGVSRDRQLSGFIALGVLLFAASLIGLFFINTFLLPGVKNDSATVNNNLTKNQVELSKVLKLQNANKVYTTKIDYLSELIDQRIPWSSIFKEIASVTPTKLWIDRMEIRNKKVDIFGRALSIDSVANFSINLNYTATLTRNAQIIVLRKYSEDGIKYVEFQLSAYINNSELALQKYNDSINEEVTTETESLEEQT